MICYDYPPPSLELISDNCEKHHHLLKYAGEIAYKQSIVYIDDTRCGDFGNQYEVTMEIDNETYRYILNTMERKEESTIPVYIAKNIGPWISELGYSIKSKAAMVDIDELLEG